MKKRRFPHVAASRSELRRLQAQGVDAVLFDDKKPFGSNLPIEDRLKDLEQKVKLLAEMFTEMGRQVSYTSGYVEGIKERVERLEMCQVQDHVPVVDVVEEEEE